MITVIANGGFVIATTPITINAGKNCIELMF